MSAFLYTPSGDLHVIPASGYWLTRDLLTLLSGDIKTVHPDSIYILHNGRLLPTRDQDNLSLSINDVVKVTYRLPGGKGGFGSMLRAIGAQIEKTTSREACRDLSGRRMRDVNDEKKIAEWVAKQADRECELARQKQERLEKRRAGPKHNFDDTIYTKQIQDNLEKIDDALKQGLKASTSSSRSEIGVKRTSTIITSANAQKKRKMWMGADDEELDDDSDEEETQMITDQPSSSTSTSTICTPATSTMTGATDVSVESNSRHERSPDLSPTSAALISTTNTDTSDITSGVSSDSSSEGNSSDAAEIASRVAEGGEISKTEKRKPGNEMNEGKKDEEKTTKEKDMKPFNIDDYDTAEELESLGLEPLKEHLKALGLKCGGTLQERAQRLFSTKGKTLKDLDPSLFAKPSKGKKPKKK